jgi:hypothetical protein
MSFWVPSGTSTAMVVGLMDSNDALVPNSSAVLTTTATAPVYQLVTLPSPQVFSNRTYSICMASDNAGAVSVLTYLPSWGGFFNFVNGASGNDGQVYKCSNPALNSGASLALPAACGTRANQDQSSLYAVPVIQVIP